MLQPTPMPVGPTLDLRPNIESLPSSKIREIAHADMGRADLIPLWFDEPDTPTPKFICDAAPTGVRVPARHLDRERRGRRAPARFGRCRPALPGRGRAYPRLLDPAAIRTSALL